METDATLLRRYATHRDAEAYTELTRRYARLVYGTSLRIVGNRADAEDITQDCFLTLAQQAGRIRQSLAGWLHASARTRSLDTIRQRRRRESREAKSMPPASEGGQWEQTERLVDEALAELPDESRQAVQLHFLAGRTQLETAIELGISQPTVSRRLERGIEQLRSLLEAKGVALSAGALALGLSAQATAAVPAQLAESLAKIGMAGVGESTALSGLTRGSMGIAGKVAWTTAMLVAILAAGYGLIAADSDKSAYAATRPAASQPVAAAAAGNAMDAMQPFDGQWRREGDTWVGVAGSGEYAHLVSSRQWAGDAIAAEFDGRADAEAMDSARWMYCNFSAYRTPAESAKALEMPDQFGLRGSFVGHPSFPWTSVEHGYPAGQWSRDHVIARQWGDLSIDRNQWYHIKAERIGQMLRLWVDGVPVSEMRDEHRAPERAFVWLGSRSATNSFRNLSVYRPDDQYIARFSKPVKVFSPSQQRTEILARYPDTVVHEASVKLGEVISADGLDEVPFSGRMSEPAHHNEGGACRRFTNSPESRGTNYELVDKQSWNGADDVYVEVEYLDVGLGSLSVLYQAWWGFPASEDVVFGNSGQWKTARLWLREADLRRAPGACLWIAGLRLPNDELYLRSVRLVAVSKPKEAWEEVVRAYEEEIRQRTDEWTIPHYMIEIARILETKLGRTVEANGLAKQVREKYPTSSCLPMYPRWQSSISE